MLPAFPGVVLYSVWQQDLKSGGSLNVDTQARKAKLDVFQLLHSPLVLTMQGGNIVLVNPGDGVISRCLPPLTFISQLGLFSFTSEAKTSKLIDRLQI